MILSLKEIAQRLRLSVETLERWIRQGRIPVSKTGEMGVFHEAELNKWAARQKKVIPDSGTESAAECTEPGFILVPAMENGGVTHSMPGKDRDAVLKAAAGQVPGLTAHQQKLLLEQLLDRESLTSTGIGQGVAIPHPRNPLKQGPDTPMIVTCFLETPVSFNAIDDLPVSILFLILSPTVPCHLNLLSRLSFCLRDSQFISMIKSAPTKEKLIECVRSMEKQIEKKGV